MRFDLLNNSRRFLREAAENAREAHSTDERWAFAILHGVQALELTLKAMLVKQHPLFIYENIDSPTKTVSLTGAMDRLSNPRFGFGEITETERRKISKAVDLRNQITHSEFDCSPEYAAAKFAEVFGLVTFLQSRHFDVELEALIDADAFSAILAHGKSFEELCDRAHERIDAENIDWDKVWMCPQCDGQALVIQDGIDTCYVCRHKAGVTYCKFCQELLFADDLEDFSDAFDYDLSEGQRILIENYGYLDRVACHECAARARDKIEQQRLERYHHDMLEEDYHRRQQSSD